MRIKIPLLLAVLLLTGCSSTSNTATELEEYIQEGKVVRLDQEADVVSEGQAYMMLISALEEDEKTFQEVWEWTRVNLQREDRLLSWQWRDGKIVDTNSASDADLFAAWALIEAGERFNNKDYLSSGEEIADAVMQKETRETSFGLTLTAGNWDQGNPIHFNPSYITPQGLDKLEAATGDSRWGEIKKSANMIISKTLDDNLLVPDWVQIENNEIRYLNVDNQNSVYSFDASRVSVFYRHSCHQEDQKIAETIQERLPEPSEAMAWELDGTAIESSSHPVFLLAKNQTRNAEKLNREHPTYYGTIMLELNKALDQNC